MYSTDHVGLWEAFLCKNEVCNKKNKSFSFCLWFLSPSSPLFSSPASRPVTQSWGNGSYCIVNYWWGGSHTAGCITAVQHPIHSRAKTHEWSICAMKSLYFHCWSVLEKQSTHNVWCCSSSMEIKMYMKKCLPQVQIWQQRLRNSQLTIPQPPLVDEPWHKALKTHQVALKGFHVCGWCWYLHQAGWPSRWLCTPAGSHWEPLWAEASRRRRWPPGTLPRPGRCQVAETALPETREEEKVSEAEAYGALIPVTGWAIHWVPQMSFKIHLFRYMNHFCPTSNNETVAGLNLKWLNVL